MVSWFCSLLACPGELYLAADIWCFTNSLLPNLQLLHRLLVSKAYITWGCCNRAAAAAAHAINIHHCNSWVHDTLSLSAAWLPVIQLPFCCNSKRANLQVNNNAFIWYDCRIGVVQVHSIHLTLACWRTLLCCRWYWRFYLAGFQANGNPNSYQDFTGCGGNTIADLTTIEFRNEWGPDKFMCLDNILLN